MQLQLRCVSFQCSHLDNACFLKVIETEHIILDVFGILNHTSKRVHDIHEIVAFIVDLVNFGATFGELAFKCESNDVLNYLWVRLVANFKDIFFVDLLIETRGSCLQIV